jgi:class 3 adenylate cyclase/tetratricopeptide (TPR) repeat protein
MRVAAALDTTRIHRVAGLTDGRTALLFADLKGSMELLADRDPEEARQLLDPVLERMMAAVHRYEGTVNQVMGDGVMALFGAPIAHEDHAVRACYAALAMQASVQRYAAEVQRTKGVPIQMRVGLNSGEVVVRAIGSDLHMDYTAVGQTTHLAARMEQMATPDSVLITAQTLKLAEGLIQVNPLGSVPIKGLADPMEVFELVGAGPTRARWQAFATRGLTRFVGRQHELAILHQAVDRVGTGQAQIVAVIGEPGIGKTRLFHEFIQFRRIRGWLVLEGSAVSYGKAIPYLPIIELLKAYFAIEDRDEEQKIREKVTGKLVTLDTALGPTLPAFLTLLDVPVQDAAWQALDPPQRRQRTLDAVKRLLLRESQVQPLLLIVENLQWIDTETQALLDIIVESVSTARMLLLVNYRPQFQHGWGRKTHYTQLRLGSLPPGSAEELLQVLLGDDAGLTPLKQRLIDRTEGNPFFLEESVRTLMETRVLVGERGAYRLAKALPSIQIPATVQVVLAARIDRLPPEEKRLLQAAAVIGKDVPFALLQAIAELPEEDLRRDLAHLQAAEFLYETRLFPELEYTFKHALTHEVAYGSLLQERRHALHVRIVEAIEMLYPNRLAEQVERLAHHALQGELWEKAYRYFRQAGAKAVAHSAHREASACFEQALEALRHLPESRETLVQAIDLRLDLRNSLLPLGAYERILDHLREAEALATALGDQRRLGWVSSYMSRYFWVVGDQECALTFGQRALAIAEALDDFTFQFMATYHLGTTYLVLGDYRRAMAFLRRNVASLEGDLLHKRFALAGLPSVVARTWLVWCLAELGAFAEAIICGEEAMRIAEAVEHPYSMSLAYYGVGFLALRKGELHKAIPVLDHSLALCRATPIPDLFPAIASFLGAAYAFSGRVVEALTLLERAVEQATAMRHMMHQSLRVAWLSEAYLLAGRMGEAIAQALRALELARELKERGHEAWALRLLGGITAQRNPPEVKSAEDYYRQAMALAEELGMRPLQAHGHLGLGKLYVKIGRRDEARAELSAAIELYRAMAMTFWLPQAEAALAEVVEVKRPRRRRKKRL